MAPDRYPGDESERLILEAERLEQKRSQVYDDVSSIDVNVEQILEAMNAGRREQEQGNAEILQQLKRQEGQRTVTNILLALILAALAYRLF